MNVETWDRLTEDCLTSLKEYCGARAIHWGINPQDCIWTNVDQFSGRKSMYFSRETNSKTLDVFLIPSLIDLNKNPKTDNFDSKDCFGWKTKWPIGWNYTCLCVQGYVSDTTLNKDVTMSSQINGWIWKNPNCSNFQKKAKLVEQTKKTKEIILLQKVKKQT